MQDADSLDKAGTKKEGAFYMWTSQEIREVLGDAAPLFISYYYVKRRGQCRFEPSQRPPWRIWGAELPQAGSNPTGDSQTGWSQRRRGTANPSSM